jgi:prepilin-type processing-associated H-X9-DG protein
MFARLANTNLSYFVGLGCDYSRPDSVLAGDRNLTNDFMTQAFIRLHRGWRWTVELHRLRGNLLFADGHVEEKNTPALTDMGADSFAKLAFPTLPSDGSPSAVSPAVPASSSPAKSRKERARSEPGFTFNNSGILVLREGSPSPSNQTGSSGSTPEVRPAAPPSPGVEVRIITNTTSEIQPPRVVEAPVEKPGPTREPGFSLFPPWVTTMFFDVAKIGMWTLCLLMLIAAAVCFFQLRSALRKNSSTQTKLESEDSQ